MKVNKLTDFYFLLFLLLFLPQPDLVSQVPDTTGNGSMTGALKPRPVDSSAVNSKDTLAGNEEMQILARYDSLVQHIFYFDTVGQASATWQDELPAESDTIPVFTDSIVEQRIAELNRELVIPLGYNKYVQAYIKAYTVKKREQVSRMLGLSQLWFPFFEEMLDKYNLPLELKYLAVVESGLNPRAVSRAGAKGLWQFMYGTGKHYGLKVTSLVDDRFDPVKATDAACRHLSDLYSIYDDWTLALAAYNSGAGNVNKAIRRSGGKRSYWSIWPYLPRETRGYVPAFYAAVYVMNYAEEYQIYPSAPAIVASETDTIMLSQPLALEQVSEFLNVDKDLLEQLNPAYKVGIIPASHGKPMSLRLPVQYIPVFISKYDTLTHYKTRTGLDRERLMAEIKKAEERNIHIVRSGENLGLIANRYHVSVRQLKSWNNLSSNTIYPGQKLVVFAPGYSSGRRSSEKKSAVTVASGGVYTVRSGDNLGLIAQRNGCTVTELKIWNNLNSNLIKPGQKLLVSAPEKSSGNDKSASENNDNLTCVYHTVKKGDTLWDIAKMYDGVTVEQIKQLNNIRNSNRLKPGQKIRIAVKG